MNSNLAEKALTILSDRKNISKDNLANKLGTKNVKAAIENLRSLGYAIYTNKNGNGVFYRMGNPTREVVAAGYAALAKNHPFGK
jgi:biotin operon repressor